MRTSSEIFTTTSTPSLNSLPQTVNMPSIDIKQSPKLANPQHFRFLSNPDSMKQLSTSLVGRDLTGPIDAALFAQERTLSRLAPYPILHVPLPQDSIGGTNRDKGRHNWIQFRLAERKMEEQKKWKENRDTARWIEKMKRDEAQYVRAGGIGQGEQKELALRPKLSQELE